MKKIILVLWALIILGSCSAPKYSYNFDYHNYNAGRKQTADQQKTTLPVDPLFLVASVNNEPVVMDETPPAITLTTHEPVVLTKKQRKVLQLELKKIVKENKTSRKAEKEQGVTKATASGIDHDLKLAAIFGAVGIVGLLIGTSANVIYIIGAIALLIGVVFFVKWLIRQ